MRTVVALRKKSTAEYLRGTPSLCRKLYRLNRQGNGVLASLKVTATQMLGGWKLHCSLPADYTPTSVQEDSYGKRYRRSPKGTLVRI